MASHGSTPRSRSPSSTSSDSSDTTMLDAPPLTPAQPRPASHGNHPSAAEGFTKDASFSLLLSLPRELRDKVYFYALTSALPFWWPTPQTPTRHSLALGLLTTSRQVYEEAAPILYQYNKFLFTHPSDCNIFRVVASPKYSAQITTVYFRIRDKDHRLWTAYLGSKVQERSLKHDLPKLKNLWIFLRCSHVGAPFMFGGHGVLGLPAALAAQVQVVQNALGQQVQALQQQVHNLQQSMAAVVQLGNVNGQPATAGPVQPVQPAAINGMQPLPPPPPPNNNNIPPPPPPPPAMPFFTFANAGLNLHQQLPHQQQPHNGNHHHPPPPPLPPAHGTQNNPPNPGLLTQAMLAAQHQHPPFYASFMRWERELGLENICLSLQETRPKDADVKVVCIMRVPKPEVGRLARLYPEELQVDRAGDARTRFRRLHGVDVSLEVSGFEIPAS
ncbi:hypothetical protein P154DRAFT_526208 [Amniculicola lignicola CBS 123094]|uniref:DUF7730 domain-containing protein n=1 Tax=Amniculicola lignicola CBS 123094 TaxID=1392246 RepID=A0A6A5W137_9PLEO|nr:hypothetical protein P154DRAFT_526208 [Amniculicola lignicola CBS 123094]